MGKRTKASIGHYCSCRGAWRDPFNERNPIINGKRRKPSSLSTESSVFSRVNALPPPQWFMPSDSTSLQDEKRLHRLNNDYTWNTAKSSTMGEDAMTSVYAPAGFWRRFVAQFLDGLSFMLMIVLICFVLNFVFGIAFMVAALSSKHPSPSASSIMNGISGDLMLGLILSFGIGAIRYAGFLRKRQGSPGSRWLGIYITRQIMTCQSQKSRLIYVSQPVIFLS